MAKKKGMSPNTLLAVGLGACAALIVIALGASRFLKSEPPPPPPPPPPPVENTIIGQMRYTEAAYKARVGEDLKTFGLPAMTPQQIAQPLVYADELPAKKTLKPEKDGLDTPHLHLSTSIRKEWAATADGQRFRFEHLILSITNKSDKPIAYRVETTIDHPEKCKSKGSIEHNAIALKPGETIERTECLWRPGANVTVKRVEVMELNDLAYFYVSQLTPSQVLIDERTSIGHALPKGTKECRVVPWRDIQEAAKGGTGWADVIDFYARHNCDEYSFFKGYARWTAPGPLPSHPGNTPAAAPAPKPAK